MTPTFFCLCRMLQSLMQNSALLVGIISVVLYALIMVMVPLPSLPLEGLPRYLQDWFAKGEVYSVHGKDMFVMRLGDSPLTPVILMHGFPSSSYEYHRVAALLSQHRPVVLYDHVGFGFSAKPAQDYPYSMIDQADQSLALWRQLGVRRAHIVSHDMGDTILSEILGRRHRGELPSYFDDFFASVTFTNGGMVYEKIVSRLSQSLLRRPLVGDFLQGLMLRLDRSSLFSRAQLKSVWSPTYAYPEQRDSDINDTLSLLRHDGGHLLMTKLIYYLNERGYFEHRWHPMLGTLTIDCMILWGDSDAVAPLAIYHELVRLTKGKCKSQILEGVGHFGQLEAPDKWVESVLEFIKVH